MVQNQIDIKQALQHCKPTLNSFGVKRLGLFGSFTRNEQTSQSDIDFWVKFQQGQKKYRNLLNLGDFLEKLFQRKVDLITPESLSATLKREILKEMRYVVEIQWIYKSYCSRVAFCTSKNA